MNDSIQIIPTSTEEQYTCITMKQFEQIIKEAEENEETNMGPWAGRNSIAYNLEQECSKTHNANKTRSRDDQSHVNAPVNPYGKTRKTRKTKNKG